MATFIVLRHPVTPLITAFIKTDLFYITLLQCFPQWQSVANKFWSFVKLSGLVNDVTKMVTECLRTTKVAIFAILKKNALVKYDRYWTLFMFQIKRTLFLNYSFHLRQNRSLVFGSSSSHLHWRLIKTNDSVLLDTVDNCVQYFFWYISQC